MKKYAFSFLLTLFILSCDNQENSIASAKDTVSVIPKKVEVNTVDSSNDGAKSFISEKFTLTELKNDEFGLTVYFDKKSFTTKVKVILDDKNITPTIYKEMKKREGDDLKIWVNKNGVVTDILMMEAKKKNDSIGEEQSIYIRGEYPITGYSRD